VIQLELDKLQKHLQDKKIHAQLQKETKQLCIILKIADKEFPLFIRIFEGQELLQMLAFLPCNTQSSTIADTARLLHLLNKELDIPGFGMDESTSVVFYRCLIPGKDKQIDEGLIDAFLNAVELVCKSFAAVIAAVSYGAVTFEDVLRKSKEQQGQSFSQSQLDQG
jgi:hypothetical protein